jgi:hypothetical protein
MLSDPHAVIPVEGGYCASFLTAKNAKSAKKHIKTTIDRSYACGAGKGCVVRERGHIVGILENRFAKSVEIQHTAKNALTIYLAWRR